VSRFGNLLVGASLTLAAPAFAAPPSTPAQLPSASSTAPPAVPFVPFARATPARSAGSLENRRSSGQDLRIGKHERVNDVEAIGGDLAIYGTVEGSVKVVGGDLLVRGPVAGDIELMGGDARIDSEVGGDVWALGGDVKVNGVVAGDLFLRGGEVAMGPAGRVLGKVRGRGDIDDREFFAAFSPAWLKRLLPEGVSALTVLGAALKLMTWAGACLLALLVLWLDRLRLLTAVDNLSDDPLRAFAWGFISAFGLVLAAVVLLVSIIGIPLAGVVLMLFGAALYMGLSVSAAAVGALLPLRFVLARPWLQVVAGAAILALLSALPWVGTPVMFSAALLGVGAAALAYRAPRRTVVSTGAALSAYL
jgi:cytoskeletal protein CcmA (bactofilin family)